MSSMPRHTFSKLFQLRAGNDILGKVFPMGCMVIGYEICFLVLVVILNVLNNMDYLVTYFP